MPSKHSLENSLVDRVRRCWNKRPHPTPEARANLKDAISELRTYRTNREINPELHATLDREAMQCFHSGGLLGYTEQAWDTYCHNKHQLTTRFDEPKQETLIQGLPVTTEQAKGRVRMHPPKERITRDYFTQTLTDIENDTLTPYLPVREMCRFINESKEKKQFLMRIRALAFKQKDHELHGKDYKRIYRVSTRTLNELHNASQLDFFDTLQTA